MTISIQDKDGNELTKTTVPHFSSVEDWQNMPNVQSIGVDKVAQYLNISLKDSSIKPIVYIPLVQKFEQQEIPNRDWKIVIFIKDQISGKTIKKELSIQVIKE